MVIFRSKSSISIYCDNIIVRDVPVLNVLLSDHVYSVVHDILTRKNS